MYQHTTPTLKLTLPGSVDLTQASSVYVSICKPDFSEILRKTTSELTISAHEVDVFLTQEETTKLPLGKIPMQINWIYTEEGITKRACSDFFEVKVKRNLLSEVI